MRTERANAKLNLLLSVGSKRPDGYHDLVSVMQTVSLCDLVTIDYRPGLSTKITLDISGAVLPSDCRNLAYRAAEEFLKKADRRGEVLLHLEKHIPMAAGLGGGSADAAAVLRGLNLLCGSPLSKAELCKLGATLGADVPFCVVGGSAVAQGVGELLTTIPMMPQTSIVVACGGEGVSTKEAYSAIDDLPPKSKKTPNPEAVKSAFLEGDLAGAFPLFFNDFEAVVEDRRPLVGKIKEAMKESGATFTMMSGSGPSVFGIFPDLRKAGECQLALEKQGVSAFVCHPTKAYFNE